MSTDNRTILLTDIEEVRNNLLPITFTRPVGAIRMGIFTGAERWHKLTGLPTAFSTVDYLTEIFGSAPAPDALTVSAHFIANAELASAVTALAPGDVLVSPDGEEIARYGDERSRAITFAGKLTAIHKLYDIFMLNDEVLRADFELMRSGVEPRRPSDTNRIVGPMEDLLIHPDAGPVECANINTTCGPVYIGPGVEVMEGVSMRGPVAILDGSTINMGARIYGATTIGPHCKIGGEVNNVVIMGYTNKAHDGFVGNAVLGEWCNIGGGCTASNLKNDYTEIKLWNYPARRFERTGLIHCGLIMADHSKAGVNSMLNTATVVGVGVNIHGTGFPRNFIASFSDGSASGFTEVPLKKFLDTARRVMARRDVELDEAHIRLYSTLYEITDQYR